MKTLGRPPKIWTPGPFSNLRRSSKIIRAVVPWNMAVPCVPWHHTQPVLFFNDSTRFPTTGVSPLRPPRPSPTTSAKSSMGAMASLNPPSDGNNHRISAAGGLEASAPETLERKQRKARGAWHGSMGSGKATEKMGKMNPLDPLDPELPQNSSRQPQYHPAWAGPKKRWKW